MELELKNAELRVGDKLKIEGRILDYAERYIKIKYHTFGGFFTGRKKSWFQIDLGYDTEDLALHFNPRFQDDTDGSVLVCNSKIAGSWCDEKREIHNPLQRGSTVKIVLKLNGDLFEVELPDGHEVQFPNRDNMDVINYVRVKGDFKLISFKIC